MISMDPQAAHDDDFPPATTHETPKAAIRIVNTTPMDSPQILLSPGSEKNESHPVLPPVPSLNLRESQPARLRSSSEPNMFDLT